MQRKASHKGKAMLFKNNIDDALSIIGYGRWQIPFFALTFLIHFLVPIQIMGSALLSVPVPFRCFPSLAVPLETTSHFNSTSLTSLTSQPPAVTYESKCGAAGQNVSLPPSSLRKTDLSSCSYVQYDHSVFPSTVVSEFNLVCERSTLRPLFQIVISLGALFGAPLGGVVSDKYGRKITVIGGAVVNLIAVAVITFCPWYTVILCSRFLVGMTVGFIVLPSYSLAQETTPPRLRSHFGMLAGLGFSVGIVVLAGEAFLVRHWRQLQLTASSSLLIIIPLACLVEESPRWLSQMGRQQETADALKRAACRNGVAVTPELVRILEKLKTENRTSHDVLAKDHGNEKPLLWLMMFSKCRSYFRYPGMRRILCVTPFVWYLQALLYLGILLNANNFTSNDPFMYVALSGVMDFTAIILTTPIAVRVGRRCLSMTLYLVSGTLLLLDMAVPADMEWLKWVSVMTAFLLCAASYQVQFIFTPELYPTVIRSRGFGFVNGTGSLGLVTAPLITDLLVQKVWWSVNVVCGLAGLLASLLVSFLPETRNLPLPETVQDVEKRLCGNKKLKDSEATEERAIHETIELNSTEVLEG
ncbi:solute carrier family 22 member 20-like isoform X2 [Portunus trituberculatus]|uniref:solute carrier family 22 member 20-like isoform X2 n=1 Tax=Portunus trituberculatus TaxID=210409 RepID=UPI001E1CD7AE|nr:solute carrier family 22 member 20-like isoform X2 [Portunus trituberculatus]